MVVGAAASKRLVHVCCQQASPSVQKIAILCGAIFAFVLTFEIAHDFAQFSNFGATVLHNVHTLGCSGSAFTVTSEISRRFLINLDDCYVSFISNFIHRQRVENNKKTRSTQRAQTSAERQHNRIAEWFLQCKLAMQLWSESTRYTLSIISAFGFRTSDSWMDPDGDSDRHQNLSPCSMDHALRLQEISSKSVDNFFSVIRWTDKQTNRQTDKQTEVKTSPPYSAEVG